MYRYRDEPIDILVRELENPYGQLRALRSSLGILTESLTSIPLSRRKKPCLTYKLTESTMYGWYSNYQVSWVVKFSPEDKQDDPWYDVKKEYDILCGLHSKGISVPAPLYCSNEDDENIIGTDFIVMEFIEGKQVDCIGDIEEDVQEDAVLSVVNFLGELHQQQWEDDDEDDNADDDEDDDEDDEVDDGDDYEDDNEGDDEDDEDDDGDDYEDDNEGDDEDDDGDDDFWKHQIATWSDNFQSASPNGIYDPFYPLFTKVSRLSPPDGDYSIIHGDMTISNVIFDDEYNVKAVIDWKYRRNGDPMMDLSYFCMMFLGRDKGLRRVNKLLAGDSVDESDVLERYCESRDIDEVDESALNFAKSVSCLRMMSIVKAAEVDNFVNHECGQYMDKKLAPKVLKFLKTACLQFMEEVD